MHDLRLLFGFEGYEVAVDLEAQVTSSDGKEVRLDYIRLQPEQIALMRYLLDAYLAGEVVTAGEILDFQRRPLEDAAARQKAAAARGNPVLRGIGGLLRAVPVLVVTLLLLFLIGSSLYQHFAVFPATAAYVTSEATPILAPSEGTVTNLATEGSTVAAGDPVLTILTPSGKSLTVNSPCECRVDDVTTRINDTPQAGSRLMSLREPDAKPYIFATVDRSRLMDAYKGVVADVELVDGAILRNLPVVVPPGSAIDDTGTTFSTRIYLDHLPANIALGQPTRVTFFRNGEIAGLIDSVGLTPLAQKLGLPFGQASVK
jgi:alginate biosynthesis protein Alg44